MEKNDNLLQVDAGLNQAAKPAGNLNSGDQDSRQNRFNRGAGSAL